MFFVLSVPFWLFVLIWIFTAPSRGRARRAAAQMQELQVVAAMTEVMKEEYWARKRAEAAATYRDPITNAKAARRMMMVFVGIIVVVVTVGIALGH
jgi:hypothetical protein